MEAWTLENLYVITGQIMTLFYFSYFIINPMLNKFWDNLNFKF